MNRAIHKKIQSVAMGKLFFLISCSLLLLHCQTRSSDSQAEGSEGALSEAAKNNTDMMNKDVLIIVSDSASKEAKAMASKLSLRQEISPRVRIVNIDAEQAAELMKQAGVYLVEGKTVPAEAWVSLTETEKLFIDGWLARIPESEKERAGEGLKWDDPNFQPPDSLK